MNLIVALMVSKMDTAEAEVILAKQRIEEISSMADITSLLGICVSKKFYTRSRKYHNSKV